MAPDAPAPRAEPWKARFRRETPHLVGLAVLLLITIASDVLEPDGMNDTIFVVVGLYLLATPASGFSAAPLPLALWFFGILAMVLRAVTSRGLPVWRRATYAYLTGALTAGLGAGFWSTLGN